MALKSPRRHVGQQIPQRRRLIQRQKGVQRRDAELRITRDGQGLAEGGGVGGIGEDREGLRRGDPAGAAAATQAAAQPVFHAQSGKRRRETFALVSADEAGDVEDRLGGETRAPTGAVQLTHGVDVAVHDLQEQPAHPGLIQPEPGVPSRADQARGDQPDHPRQGGGPEDDRAPPQEAEQAHQKRQPNPTLTERRP
jgi:hypothetical protein